MMDIVVSPSRKRVAGPLPRSFQEPATARLAITATRALYVGPPLGVGMHRGAVNCFALALDGTLRVETSAPRSATGPVSSAMIGAGLQHRIEVDGSAAAFLYLDPADALAKISKECMRPIHRHLHVTHPDAATWARALLDGGALEVFPTFSSTVLDGRIARVIEAMRRGEQLDAGVAEIARGARLSESRFMHLFRAQAGVPLRRYRLWARLHFAVGRFGHGETWTTAALESSFASSSHLSDAFRSMFGVPPSAMRGIRILGLTSDQAAHETKA